MKPVSGQAAEQLNMTACCVESGRNSSSHGLQTSVPSQDVTDRDPSPFRGPRSSLPSPDAIPDSNKRTRNSQTRGAFRSHRELSRQNRRKC